MTTIALNGCPDVWELADGPDECIVRIPRQQFIAAKRDIPDLV